MKMVGNAVSTRCVFSGIDIFLHFINNIMHNYMTDMNSEIIKTCVEKLGIELYHFLMFFILKNHHNLILKLSG